MAGNAAQQFEAPEGLPNPDEDGALDEADDLEIEVLDDTPLEDVREARPAADRLDPDSADFEAEIQGYSDNAQKRIKAVKFEYHEERRAKESAERRSEEAVRYAEQVTADNKALQASLNSTNTVLAEQYGARNDAELEKARANFKEAYEGGETDALLEAQEELSRLHAERVRVPQAPQAPRAPQAPQAPQAAGARPPDNRAMKWIRDNSWFQKAGHEDMTGYAVGLHQKLVAKGYNPEIHEDYYREIDAGMRTVFPDYEFSEADLGGKGDDDDDDVEVITTPVATPKKQKPPVGGPSRGGKPSRKVQLTATQVALAKRFGLTNKQYAAQVVKEAEKNG